MRYFLTILLLCSMVNGFAANNYITIQVNGGMNYNINTTTGLETDQTITNAFQLKVLNNSNACHVYVRLSAWNYPAAWVPVNNYPLQVIWSSDDSPNDANIASTTTVNTSDQLLFTQPSHAGATPYNYYYKLKLLALGYTDYIPGTYNYTFTFTMTEP
ncbi:MAG: hypothetical protein JSS82_00635 [Bacteroidetes bacterium]|nr:hypothetical protein [Bacteroidota bacterium]